MNPKQIATALKFKALHEAPGTFLIPNPWDPASARILSALGFPALATSSVAAANLLGRQDGTISRDEALRQFAAIASATDLPVSADLGKGYADSPDEVAQTIQLAAEAGLVGGSIEDATDDPERPIYDLNFAVERVSAAVAAARRLPFPFMLVARAENLIRGRPDLDDTLKRLLAYEKAGADVLFAPGLPNLAAVREVCLSVSKPVNFVVGAKGRSFSVAELAQAGVKRISFGGSLHRAAMTGLLRAAEAAIADGTFGYIETTLTSADFSRFIGI